LPATVPTFGAALVGRLSYGLLPLAVLFTVHAATGSYTPAGGAVAGFGLTTILLPLKTRLPRALPVLGVGCAAALTTIALLPSAPAAVYVLLAVAAGLCAPPLGPAMRANWRALTEGTDLLGRAYSLDSVCEETLYLVGPLAVGVLLAVASAAVALLVTAGLLVAGSAGLAALGRASAERQPLFGVGALRARGLRPLLGGLLVAATGMSMAITCVAVRAQTHGQPAAAGYIEATLAAGSVAGGLLWGRLRHRRGHVWHLGGLTAALAAGVAVAAVADNLVVLGAVMAATGLAVAPLFVVSYLAADEFTPPPDRTEASAWVNVANNLGSAAGSSVAAVVADRAGTTAGFVIGSVLLALSALCFLLWRRMARLTKPATG
jgi:hypothetical protein